LGRAFFCLQVKVSRGENGGAMGTRDKRVDAVIAKSQDFAKPIMEHLRAAVHEGCPECEETIKWSMPFFMYKGSILCMMASFKQHCTFGFWRASGIGPGLQDEAMGSFGRITSVKDLPAKKTLVMMVQQAVQRKDMGVKPAPKPRKAPQRLVVPSYFMAAVKKNKKALATFEAFPYSKRKDYVEWVTEAKGEETRARRLKTSVEWLAEGKARHWKYERC
jgi:uncharacterized protein YdeI (YjbR/CyaY-like superfamily)